MISVNRRAVVKSALLGTVVVPISAMTLRSNKKTVHQSISPNYPSIDLETTKQVVLYAHFDLDRLKALVDERPELSRSSYDWAFGDWESAIGAGSHVGRWDIIDYLMDNGARATIFTHIALGQADIVKAIIESNPVIKKTVGPHGITLLQHAKISLRSKDRSAEHIQSLEKLSEFLESETASFETTYLDSDPEELAMYEGDYFYGEGLENGLSVKINRRNMIALGRLGTFGGGLFKVATHRFVHNGTPSTEISFEVKKGESVALNIHEPGSSIKAIRKG